MGTHLLPRRDLCVVVDAWDIGHASCGEGDWSGLGYDEGAGGACTLSVVVLHDRSGDVVRCAAHASHGREHDAVLKGDIADLDGLKELWERHRFSCE